MVANNLLKSMLNLDELWYQLNRQPVHAFADWSNREIPKGQPGVYLVYQGSKWIYIGMSFKNLQSRLNQHASGRRSGDQFCVYLGDRLVMPKLDVDLNERGLLRQGLPRRQDKEIRTFPIILPLLARSRRPNCPGPWKTRSANCQRAGGWVVECFVSLTSRHEFLSEVLG